VRERFIGVRHAMSVFAFLDGAPRFSAASMSSCAKRTAMLFSERDRAASIAQRIASVSRRAARTSTGT